MNTTKLVTTGYGEVTVNQPANWGAVEWQRYLTLDGNLAYWLYLLNLVIPVTLMCGGRTAEEQIQFLKEGKSKVGPDKSKHCTKPKSLAVDIGPDPYQAKDLRPYYFMGGYGKALAKSLGIKLRWGGDFNRNNVVTDETFLDLVHFEIDE